MPEGGQLNLCKIMKNIRPFIYLGIAIFVAAVVFLFEGPGKPRVSDVDDGYFVIGFDIDKIGAVTITQLVDGVQLRRKDSGWEVRDFATPLKEELLKKEGREGAESAWQDADITRVSSALGRFGGLDKGVIVSSNSEKQSLFQVDAAGLKVSAFDKENKPLFEVIIGKMGPDFTSTYIRRANEDKVYLVNRSMVGVISPRASDWMVKEEKTSDQNQ